MSLHKIDLKAHADRITPERLDYKAEKVLKEVPVTAEVSHTHKSSSFELELLSEPFYYLAGRPRSKIKPKPETLPELEILEVAGSRSVRNKFIENAKLKDSEVLIQSFGFDCVCGTVIKLERYFAQQNVSHIQDSTLMQKKLKKSLIGN